MPVFVGTSVGMIRKQYREGIADKIAPADSFRALPIPIAELFLLALFYVLAMAYRREVGRHMRYIICGRTVLITPSLARVAGYWFSVPQVWSYALSFLVTDAVLGGLILFDRQLNAPFGPYVLALAAFLLFEAAWVAEGRPF